MKNTFYIAASPIIGGTWYQLLVKDTHFCVSCGSDLDKIVSRLRDYVKTYRTKDNLLRVLSELDCQGKVSPATFSQREDFYLAHGEDYADLVDKAVSESLREMREEDKKNNPLRKTTSRLKKAGGIKTIQKTQEVSPKVDSSPVKDSPKESTSPATILRKPRLFKRK